MYENKALTTTLQSIESGTIPILGLSLTNHPNISAGQYISKANTQTIPQFTADNLDADKTYLVAVLDLDTPLISFSFLAPILHLLQPGAKFKGGSTSFSEEAIASWHPAGPPPSAAPHRYQCLLYEQPSTFDVAKYRKPGGYGMRDRIRFRWDEFEEANGLGKPIATNYFTSN
ncbi:MAG: hypothetical protein GOMPHAMPRED_002243 [Gomphillus americanus]|uniref:PEBP-like protein n=1 Tax=Gomphillus americanus TaxID=1940652 RepID=A0A8H3FAN2_9LECA|nr:MAG: hypothetical protein GOMPHAMPRED_002243 [Gomphillus americanus]